MLVLHKLAGQRSNHFMHHIHLDAYCKEHGIKFCNLYFRQYKKYYPSLKLHNNNLFFRILFRTIVRLNWYLKIFRVINFNLEYRGYVDRSDEIYPIKGLTFCEGFHFRADKLVKKYREEYKKQFEPNIDKESFKKKYFIKTNDNSKIIGIHIRRGDYINYRDGIYFYDDDTYIEYMIQLSNLLSDNCTFILFTNDSQLNFDNYKSKFGNRVLLSKEDIHIDHFLMSECDYLLGPPSSFSLWASFIGKAKLYQAESKNEILSLSKFEECESCIGETNNK